MYFSEHFDLTLSGREDWFDPILSQDTQLFVDPFLIFKEESGTWADAHGELIAYFQQAFEILSPVFDRPNSPAYKKTLELMAFPEPRAFGLGFVAKSSEGSGTGRVFAARMVDAMSQAIRRGLSNLRHFEELTLLVDRIGRDRISDITCNILITRFIAYTQEVASELDVPLEQMSIAHSAFDTRRLRWVPSSHLLPKNPITGEPVLLTPRRFLRELPHLNAEDWWNYVEPQLRNDLNLDINRRLRKPEIVALARRFPDTLTPWASNRERDPADPYDVERDPEGRYQWLRHAQNFALLNPLAISPVRNSQDLSNVVEALVDRFKLFVEHQGGWRLLFNDDTGKPKRETSIQLLFKGVVQSYCQANGIRIDREVELGRGPVDFAFSTGYNARVLLEVKKMSNGDFWNGLERQLTSYMISDESSFGWYLPVRLSDRPIEVERASQLAERTREASEATGEQLSIPVDRAFHAATSTDVSAAG